MRIPFTFSLSHISRSKAHWAFAVSFVFHLLIFYSCSAPRSVLHSGKVTPHKTFRGGVDYSGNVPTQPIKLIVNSTKDLISTYKQKDSVELNDEVVTLNKIALSYALDPFSAGFNFWGRYGLIKRVDAGYKYSSGANVFDARFQLLGSANRWNNPSEKRGYGSIGIQYSWQKYDLPKWTGMNFLQEFLGLDFRRKDILVPLVFSYSFGPEEKYGAISGGFVYSHSFIHYSVEPSKKIFSYADSAGVKIPKEINAKIDKKIDFPALGGFFNVKAGVEYVYAILGLSVYYQKYGTFDLIGGSTAEFKGTTFVPTIGILFDAPLEEIFGKKKDSEDSKKN